MKQITSLMIIIISGIFLVGCLIPNNPPKNPNGDSDPPVPTEVRLSISPFAGGFHIQWQNIADFERAGGMYLHLNLTSNDIPPELHRETIAIANFTDNSYNITGLINDTAYRLVEVSIGLAGNVSRVVKIGWSQLWPTNELDNNGEGIGVGANHDGDGQADWVDTDDDNDGVNDDDNSDNCPLVANPNQLDTDNDTMGDVCDEDDDNDGVADRNEEVGCSLKVDCDDDMVLDVDEAEGCALLVNCDNDDLEDSEDWCPAGLSDWRNDGSNDVDNDGCRNDEDIDDDGDGLIEIGKAEELDAVRWVLDGTGFKVNERAMLNQSGCGDGMNMTVCNGYELVRDISLTDYIADNYPTVGWQPIAHDVDDSNTETCKGEKFTAIFDGNSFDINGLFINRSTEDCIGLFGQANGTIRHLELIAGTIIGNNYVGSLIGDGEDIEITHSCVVSSTVRGSNFVGGMLGNGRFAKMTQSCAVSGEVKAVIATGNHNIIIGGLAGWANFCEIIQSYAVSGTISGDNRLGGLVGESQLGSIIQSYAVSGVIGGNNILGGMVGNAPLVKLVHSYAVSGTMSGQVGGLGGLVASEGGRETARDTYWDIKTSGITNDMASGSSGQTTSALRSPTGYTGIYATWDDGVGVEGINDNTTIWCDEDSSGSIEGDERRDDNKVWDFGTTTDYPGLRCTPDSLTDQRAWWSLSGGDPQLNQTRLDAYLDGSLN